MTLATIASVHPVDRPVVTNAVEGLAVPAMQAVAPSQAAQAPSQPAAPPAPGQAAAGQATGIPRLEELLGRPATAADVQAIRNRASQLSSQLNSAQGRREEVARELSRTSDPQVREGLQQRLRVLDDRLSQLELDIAANSRLRAAAYSPALTETSTSEPSSMSPIPNLSQGGFIAISVVFTIFVLAPIATALARRLWRTPAPVASSPQLDAQARRIERIEQAVDAVAIEVERISEGQRFVTQLLSQQRESQAIGAGRASES